MKVIKSLMGGIVILSSLSIIMGAVYTLDLSLMIVGCVSAFIGTYLFIK